MRDDEPRHTIRSEDLAGFVAQAVETFLGRVVADTYAAINAAGERDYLGAEDVESIYRFVAAAMDEHRWWPPSVAQIVETCRRLNVRVVL